MGKGRFSQMTRALRAARQGRRILPLNWAKSGKCGCGDPECGSVGKHPLTAHGVNDATTNEATIQGWWREYPKANVGVATGKASDLVVLDVDPRHGGLESLRNFENENGPLPNVPAVRTGGGGLHFYFKYLPGLGNKTGLLPGLDVKSDGGYVVYPGSRHKSGRRYCWLYGRTPRKVSTAPFPASLLKLIRPRTSSATLDFDAVIPSGRRNATLTSLAGTMRSRGMTQQAIEAALLEENRLRCDPPLSNDEVSGIARSISKYPVSSYDLLSASSKNEEAAETNLKFRTGVEIANETADEVPWIVRPYVASGALTEVDAKVKLGKTTLLTHLVSAALTGLPFLAEDTFRTKCVYLTEQHLISFRPAMERANLLGRRDFTVLSWTDTLGVSWPSVVSAAVEECKKRKAGLLIVDTLGQFAGLVGDSENNAGDALKALRPLQQAAAQGIAVVIVRHERKSGGAVGDSARGSSAFAGAVDIIMSVRRPEGNQARNVRLIQTLSRFDATDDLLVELTDEGYRALGAPGEAAKELAEAQVLSAIPKSRKVAATIEDLATATGKKRAHLQRLLDALLKNAKISRFGNGRRGDPYRYFRS
jgi:hypothetical protein